jgi:hypothetical protein
MNAVPDYLLAEEQKEHITLDVLPEGRTVFT